MAWSSDSDRDELVDATTTSSPAQQPSTPPPPRRQRQRQRQRQRARRRAHRLRAKNGGAGADEEEEGQVQQQAVEAEAEDVWRELQKKQPPPEAWPRRGSRPVVVAPDAPAGGAVGEGGMGRARSLTDDDLEDLKGCVDLGFGFSYHEIPELCGTLPALELCYSMSQRFLGEHQPQLGKAEPEEAPPASPAQPVATNWKISSPGDSPEEVKARLKYWAQAVACTVRLCS
ncbi:hypothetical protein BS78_03G156200 [Paspalum vaginatum]|nr:hypothetical protein BS78_03G156200 [Paspalum vaginatum]